jgi:anti-sigma factor RsiW
VTDEADRLLDAALRDHLRVPAPPRLRRRLARRHLRGDRRWLAPAVAALAGAAVAATLLLVLRPAVPAADTSLDAAAEAVGDHQRVLASLAGRGLAVEASDMHQVKPWLTGRLDFVPPVAFLGDDEFPLKGGDVAVFLGHKAAAFVYGRRLHVISLFVFETAGAPPADADRTIRGFHVATWTAGDVGFALVSDANWDDLHRLRARLAP